MIDARAKINAKIHNMYIVYKSEKGIVREYSIGKIVIGNIDNILKNVIFYDKIYVRFVLVLVYLIIAE
jgi:hypothetical protein